MQANQDAKTSYTEAQKAEYHKIIDLLSLSDIQKSYLKSRWLDQVQWMEKKANTEQTWYRGFRRTIILASAVVPILIGWNINDNSRLKESIRYITLGLSTVIAIASAIQEFENNGERWRHYRRSVEALKTEGWQFFELSGPYASPEKTISHEQAFSTFAARVETIIQEDVSTYLTQVAQEKKQAQEQENNAQQGA